MASIAIDIVLGVAIGIVPAVFFLMFVHRPSKEFDRLSGYWDCDDDSWRDNE